MKELIKDIKKELKGCSFGMKVLLIFIAIVMFVGTLLIDFLALSLFVYAICWCLGFTFSFKFALGIYLIYLLIRGCVGK